MVVHGHWSSIGWASDLAEGVAVISPNGEWSAVIAETRDTLRKAAGEFVGPVPQLPPAGGFLPDAPFDGYSGLVYRALIPLPSERSSIVTRIAWPRRSSE